MLPTALNVTQTTSHHEERTVCLFINNYRGAQSKTEELTHTHSPRQCPGNKTTHCDLYYTKMCYGGSFISRMPVTWEGWCLAHDTVLRECLSTYAIAFFCIFRLQLIKLPQSCRNQLNQY